MAVLIGFLADNDNQFFCHEKQDWFYQKCSNIYEGDEKCILNVLMSLKGHVTGNNQHSRKHQRNTGKTK